MKNRIVSRKTDTIAVFILFALMLISVITAPLFGAVSISLSKVFGSIDIQNNPDAIIFFQTRLPRVIFALFVGGGLAVAGLIFQTLLRNSLATPFTLGVASGGAFGAVLAIKTGIVFSIFGISVLPLFSFSGSILAVFVVYQIAKTKGHLPTTTLLLAGITLNFIFSSTIMFVQYLSDFTQTFQIVRWMMGGLDIFGYETIIKIMPFFTVGLILLIIILRDLNLLGIGEEFALSKGVNTSRTKKIAFLGASLITGSLVAFSGPIGFIGLIIPHMVRLRLSADHRIMFPATFFLGAFFLIVCDTFARTIIAPTEIPVGIITALTGGPFFIWLLKTRKKELMI
ncbi:FecCD family ABC transporter permease [candidate division KSB1 bacterium]